MEKTFSRWWVVFGAILMQLCLGAIYAWSAFTPTLETAGWTKAQTQIVFSVQLLLFAVVMVVAGRFLKRIGTRQLTVLCGIVMGAGYVLAGLFGGTDLTMLVILIGVVGGAGIGIGYVVPIAVGIRWFPDKKGLISGLAVAGFGFGAMGWVKIAGSWGGLIDPADPATMSQTFIYYGIAFFVLIIVSSIWMVFPPEKKPEKIKAAAQTVIVSEDGGVRSGKMLKTLQFYLIFLIFIFSAGAGLMSIGVMKQYPVQALLESGEAGRMAAESGQSADMVAGAIAGTAMAVFFALANGLGRILWGAFSDRLGRKPSIIIMTITQGLGMILFVWMAGYEWLLYIGAFVIGFNYGGGFALFPSITADTFGAKFVGENYPYVFLAYGVGGVLFPSVGGWLGDQQMFSHAFIIAGVLCIFGAVLTMFIKPLKQVKNA